MVGPRIGKYTDGKSNAIPGHNLVLGSLGVFILWLGWFGFNAGSQLASGEIMQLRCRYYYNNKYRSSNRALAAMFVTWSVYGKPDISMTLNGVLAGLGVTAGCAAVSPVGAALLDLFVVL
jgi:Amt family ammonium transporter